MRGKMSAKSSIEWTDASWSPIVGCTRKSEGCRNCWSERFLARFGSIPGHKFEGISRFTPEGPRWTGTVRLAEDALDEPLSWRKPRRIFVCSTSDLFHEKVETEWLDRIFDVMRRARQHTFQVLTKRPENMLEYMKSRYHFPTVAPEIKPLPNVWLGVSVEDQATADERIPLLLQTPAAVRWVSYEPALGPVNFASHLHRRINEHCNVLDWIVLGGESGPGARPFDIEWARAVVKQTRLTGTTVFVKQLGALPHDGSACVGAGSECEPAHGREQGDRRLVLKDKKGGDMAEWPEDLRVREYPR